MKLWGILPCLKGPFPAGSSRPSLREEMEFGFSPLPLGLLAFPQQASCSIQAASWASARLPSRGQKTCWQRFHAMKEGKREAARDFVQFPPSFAAITVTHLQNLSAGLPQGLLPPAPESVCSHVNRAPLGSILHPSLAKIPWDVFSSLRSGQS